MKKTSIIVLAYKEPAKFKIMFDKLVKNINRADTPYEIIILLNGADKGIREFLSPDNLWYYVAKYDLNFHIIDKPRNLGASKGYNAAVKCATGHYLCFFNSDYYMQKDWLKSMIECFEHQKNIGIVSCCTNETGNADEKCASITDLKGDFKESECAIAQMFTTKNIFDEVNGFDEDYIAGFLDLDFNERIKAKGYKAFVNRKTFGYHDYNSANKYCAGHRELFRKKWGDQIADRYKWA